MTDNIRVLAVDDPAVRAYVEPEYKVLEKYESESGTDVIFEMIPWAQYYSKMMDAFQGKTKYDIVMVAGHLWAYDFVQKGYIAPVNYPPDREYDKDDILPIVMEEMKVNGTPYLYPSFCDGHIILYRKSIVEKGLGHSFGRIVTTDELISAVKRVHGTSGMYGIALKAHQSEIFLDVLPYIRNEGIDAFDSTTLKPSFNNEKGRIGVQKYMSLKDYAPQDTMNYGNDEVREAFQKHKAVFAVTWGGQLGVVLDDRCEDRQDVGFATFKTPWNVTWSFAINKISDNKEKANDFLRFLTSKEIDSIVGGYAGSPVRQSTYIKDSGKYPWYSMHLEMIRDYARPLPEMDNAGDKFGYLYNELSEVFAGKKNVSSALSDGERSIVSINEGEGSR